MYDIVYIKTMQAYLSFRLFMQTLLAGQIPGLGPEEGP